ncbi:MAG: hypothetical protein ACR2JW_13205 [Thermomicrobiales bacterium]
MAGTRAQKNQGPRDLLLLVIARAGDGGVEIAGVDPVTGSWLRMANAEGDRVFSPDILSRSNDGYLHALDTVRLSSATPLPQPPFVERAAVDLKTPPAVLGHVEERAISRTLAETAVPHLDTLLPAGKRVLTPKDFQPGGRQRSIAMLRPDQLQHIHFSYEGEDVRAGVAFRHRGQAYGGVTGLPCPDIKLRAFARAALRKEGSLSITLDGKACYNRFACGRIYLTIGLVEGADETFWPQVLGFHPIREYAAMIDYARL